MYSPKEERINSWSHGIGIPLGIVALLLLLAFDSHKTPYSTLSIVLYGVSLIVLYLASTLYHAIKADKYKKGLRTFDHISIYLLIAGTYTPVALISLVASSGWTIFWTVWGIAGIGIVLKLFFTGKFEVISLLLYLVMGWLIVFDFSSLMAQQSSLGITLLALGGAAYTFGIIFYVVEKIPYNHAIWHFFVLAGSVFHFFFIFLDVI